MAILTITEQFQQCDKDLKLAKSYIRKASLYRQLSALRAQHPDEYRALFGDVEPPHHVKPEEE